MDRGVLYLVGTPVGNLSDFTPRGVETLKAAGIIAAEDTRHSRQLLDHYGIRPQRLEAYHSHNLSKRTAPLVKSLLEGISVALISDAGSPGISDPGAVLVRAAVEAGITVCPIPGPSAVVLAVTASGFPSHRFVFEGFLPRKKGRKRIIGSWKEEERTVVFFESGVRIVKTLEEMADILGPERQVCAAREITKKFEEFLRGRLDNVIGELKGRGSVKGEFTLVLAPEGFGLDHRQEE